MFGTRIANRTARGMAVGALILSLGVTTFAGGANAAPLAEQGCSEAAHARNDAMQLLHVAWKEFSGDLRDLARDARELQREADKAGSLKKDAREAVASAQQELKGIWAQARQDIQAAVELGTACKDEGDDTTSTTSTTTTTTTTTSTTAPSDATAPADSTDGARTFDTSGLDSKYKDIVDQAIKDMQAVVDEATKAVTDITTAAESKDTTDDTKVKKDLETAKADREKAKADREEAKALAKDKSKDESDAKSSNSGKGKGKGRR